MKQMGLSKKMKGDKYLNIAYSNNEVLKKYAKVWDGIKDQIKKNKQRSSRRVWQRLHEN